MTDPVRWKAESLFLDLADWAEEFRSRLAPSSQAAPPPGQPWLGRWDERKTTPWIHLLVEPAGEMLWEQMQRQQVSHWLELSDLYDSWRRLELAKVGVVEVGGKSCRCVSLSVIQVSRLRQERTT